VRVIVSSTENTWYKLHTTGCVAVAATDYTTSTATAGGYQSSESGRARMAGGYVMQVRLWVRPIPITAAR